MTPETVEKFLRDAAGLGPGAALREEDRRKAVQVAALLDEIARIARGGRDRTLVDLGCGNAYVGLAAAALLPEARLRVVGIDRSPERIARCAEIAARLGLRADLVAGEVAEAALPEAPDVVVALHACGPATDDAIGRAIGARARHALFVPCCHRRPLEAPRSPRLGPLEALERRAAQDLARARRIEAAGYEVVAVEAWSPSVSPANVLLRARWAT